METLYADYLKNPATLQEEWKNFFDGLNDKREKILKNANGPSWSPKKRLKYILQIMPKVLIRLIMV